MIEERLISTRPLSEERGDEKSLRPQTFSEFIGQKRVTQNVELMSKSALKREAAMDHVLFSGPPGLGKTSLALLVAKTMNTELHMLSGPAIEKKGDLAAVLTNLQKGDVLFIDEIHRLHISIEEILYSAVEDFRLDIIIGQGPAARTMQIDLVPFTLVGATTKSGLLSNPLRDRFMAHLHFDLYQEEELDEIVNLSAKKLHVNLTKKASYEIARRSRGTPRIANRILRRVRDFGIVNNLASISEMDVENSLELMEIDQLGLDRMDRKILSVVQEHYQGGPVGIEALCATLGEERNTIEDVYEPYLLKSGLIIRTPRGRMISGKGVSHLEEMRS